MALDKLTKVQSVGISSFIQVVGVVTATQGFDGNITGIITATGDFSIADKIVHTGDTNTALRFPAADTFTVETAGSERLRVDSAGLIGIGINNPSEKLDVNGTIQCLNELRSKTGNDLLLNAGSANRDVKIQVNDVNMLYVKGDTGNVGIGTDNPGHLLDLYNSAGSDCLRLNVNGSAGGSNKQNAIRFSVDGDVKAHMGLAVDAGRLIGGSIANDFCIKGLGSNNILFATNESERLRITSSGNVGIGSDNPTEKLDVNGGLKVYANTNIATFKNNQLRSDAAGAYYFDHGTTGQSFTFRTSTSSSLDTTGPSVTSAGNISFPSGKGIDFSADGNASGMTSELLDDYEEGTFTPIVRGRTTAGTATYGRTAVGKYTKVGRMVDVMIDMVFSGSTGGGNIEIAGLPYAAHTGPYVRFAGDVTLLTAGISWSNQIACYINDTNSHFWITNTPTSGNYTFVNINSNTTEILIHCTYMVS
jgi:hypothetical protein